jgi:hypothetical protein
VLPLCGEFTCEAARGRDGGVERGAGARGVTRTGDGRLGLGDPELLDPGVAGFGEFGVRLSDAAELLGGSWVVHEACYRVMQLLGP